MIATLEHVALRVADVGEATDRWARQFGLTERGPGRLSCDDEPCALELVPGEPGFDHVAWGLARGVSLEDASTRLTALGVEHTVGDWIELADLEGHAIHLLPYRAPESRWTSFARPAGRSPVGHPRKLGHVNFLTGRIQEQQEFYVKALGFTLTDWLGEAGVWLHVGGIHHELAFVDKGYAHFTTSRSMWSTSGRCATHSTTSVGTGAGWGGDRRDTASAETSPLTYGSSKRRASWSSTATWSSSLRTMSRGCGPTIGTRRTPGARCRPARTSASMSAAIESERDSLEMQGVPL